MILFLSLFIVVWFTRAYSTYPDPLDSFIFLAHSLPWNNHNINNNNVGAYTPAKISIWRSLLFARLVVFLHSFVYLRVVGHRTCRKFVGRFFTNFTVWFTFRSFRSTVYAPSTGNSDLATEHQIMFTFHFFFYRNGEILLCCELWNFWICDAAVHWSIEILCETITFAWWQWSRQRNKDKLYFVVLSFCRFDGWRLLLAAIRFYRMRKNVRFCVCCSRRYDQFSIHSIP